jgi:seryl-tRNA synthetase
MPFGLWKSKFQLFREDMLHRDEKWREETRKRDAEWLEETRRRDEEWRDETRRRDEARAEEHRELLARIDQLGGNVEAALGVMTKEIVGMRGDLRDVSDSVKSQTDGIFSLIDRFDEFEGRRPPGSPPPLRPVS